MTDVRHASEWFPAVLRGVAECSWPTLCREVGTDLAAESVQSAHLQRDCDAPVSLLMEEECRRIAEVYVAGFKQCAAIVRRMLAHAESATPATTQWPQDALDAIIIKVLHLDSFFVMNEATLHLIFKSQVPHVQWNAIARQLLEARAGPMHSSIVLSVSRLCRLRRAVSEDEEGQWVPPDVFERGCTKYYVPPHQAFRTKLFWCRVIPVLQYHKAAAQDDDLLTSCYYDSPGFDLYEQRLQRIDMSQVLRVRWYGELTEDSRVFVEIKTHRSKSSGEKSTKERFPLPSTQLDAFMAGRWSPESYFDAMASSQAQCDKWIAIASRAQHLVKTYSLQPRVLTVYRRTAFQDWKTNTVRVSLDTDLKMVFLRNQATSSWLGAPNGIPGDALPGDVFTVPWAILEVKLAGPPDPLVQQAIDDMEAAIQPAGKFSKFLTGMAVHYSEQVKELPCWWEEPNMAAAVKEHQFPSPQINPALQHGPHGYPGDYFLLDRRASIERQSSFDLMVLPPVKSASDEQSQSSVESTSGYVRLDIEKGQLQSGHAKQPQRSLLCPWSCRLRQPTGKKRIQKRLDAKCHFSNERTFIRWLMMGVLLATLSAGLVEIRSVMGLWLMPVALLTAVYAIVRYYLRTRALAKGINTGIQDLYGPVVLAVAVITAVGMSYATTLRQAYGSMPSETDDSPSSLLDTALPSLPFQFHPLLGNIRGLAHVNSSMMLAVGAGYLCELHLDTFSHHIEWLPSYKFTSIAVLNASDALLLSESPPRLLRYDFVAHNTKAIVDLNCMPPSSLQSMVPIGNISFHSAAADFLLIGGTNGALQLLHSPPSFAFDSSTPCEYVPLDPLPVLSMLEMELRAAWISPSNHAHIVNGYQTAAANDPVMNPGYPTACQESLSHSGKPLRHHALRTTPCEQVAFHLQSPAVLAFASITSAVVHVEKPVVDLLFADLQTVVQVDLVKGITLGKRRIPLGPGQQAIAMTYMAQSAYYSMARPVGLIAMDLPEQTKIQS